jgi:hypothetical protein
MDGQGKRREWRFMHGWIVARAHKDLCNPIAMLAPASELQEWGFQACFDMGRVGHFHGVDRSVRIAQEAADSIRSVQQ